MCSFGTSAVCNIETLVVDKATYYLVSMNDTTQLQSDISISACSANV